jgi:23S rRNA (adenine2503-C2)-methyltransferase
MTLEKLKALLEGQPPFRLKQAQRAVFQEAASGFEEITTLPAELRKKLKDQPLLSLSVDSVQVSSDGRAHKAALKLADGRRMESVLMSPSRGCGPPASPRRSAAPWPAASAPRG